MSQNKKLIKSLGFLIFILIFIFIYFSYLTNYYLVPQGLDIPIILLSGFTLIILGVFYFFLSIFQNNKQNKVIIRFNFLSENSIKIVIILLMILAFFIKPIEFSESIIDWNQIGILNYIKGFIFLIGSIFIPGSSIYRIFFSNNKIHEKLDIEPFFLKITIYPIISISYLGISTFLLDNIGLPRKYFDLILFISIIGFFIIDILIQKQRNENRFIMISKITLSKFTALILIFSIGAIIISFGVHVTSQYLIPGDRWRGIMKAVLVGLPEVTPSVDTSIYTLYWGYISFALGKLCGIPYVNVNAMLFLFQYLFVCSIYLLIKVILRNFKGIYALLSTILFLMFSGLFNLINEPFYYQFPYLGLLQFSYHTFALISLFISLALYVSVICNPNYSNLKSKSNKKNLRIVFLSVFILLQSFFTYFLPAIVGVSLVIIYFVFSKNKRYSFKIFSKFWVYVILIFIPIDIISFFYFSWIPTTLFSNFLGTPVYIQAPLFSTRRFLASIVVDMILIGFLCCIFITKRIYFRFYLNRFKKYYKVKKKLIFIMFFAFLTILIVSNIFFNIFSVRIQDFYIFYLDMIFSNIGIIGIIGIYASYKCYKEEKRLFYILSTWATFLILLSSIFVFSNWVNFYPSSPLEIPEEIYLNMNYWFDRIWFYSIIPLSILSSFGLLSLLKYLRLRNSKSLKLITTICMLSVILFSSFSNTIISGMFWSTREDYYILNEEAQMIGWISKNIDRNSNILIDRYRLKPRIDDLTYSTTYYLWEEENRALENYTGFLTSYRYDSNCLFEAENNYEGHDNVTVFTDQNDFGQINFDIKLDSKQTNGSIEFFIATNNTSKDFYIYLEDSLKLAGIILSIKDNSFNLYNGSTLNNVSNIESNEWYHIKVDFECTDGSFTGLEKEKYRLTINGNVTIISNLLNFINNIQYIKFISDYHDYGMKIHLDNINFSWVPNNDIEKYIFYPIVLINHLKFNNIQYFVISKNLRDYYKHKDLLKYYNIKLYEYLNLELYCPNE